MSWQYYLVACQRIFFRRSQLKANQLEEKTPPETDGIISTPNNRENWFKNSVFI
jgi:hypothetical protein